jgi:hypothetical protein
VTVRARPIVLALALLLASARGLAQTAPIPEPAPPNGLPVVITVGSSELPADSLENALRRELGVPLSFDPLAKDRLEIVITGNRANVTYYRSEGGPVTRSVDLPKDEGRAIETIAFLAGNLARDEAAELLAELAPVKDEPAVEPEPPPVAPPVAEPKSDTAVARPARKSGELIEPRPFAFNLSLWHPMTLLPNTEQRRMSLEIGLAHSRLGALRGAAFTLGYLRIDQPSEGYAHAVLWNRAGPFKGIQWSEFVNEGHGPLTGISYAHLVNFRDGDVLGAQGSGLYVQGDNIIGFQGGGLVAWADSLRGVQLSGVGGYVGGRAEGVMISGTTAIVREDFEGVRLSGLFGYTRDLRGAAVDGLVAVSRDVTGVELAGVSAIGRDVTGVQASPLFNFARDLHGLQLGAVNVARKVKGVQIGVVNVADDNDSGAIGLVNVSKNGKIQPSVWFSGPDFWLNAGVKFLTGYTYALLGAAYTGDEKRFRYEAGGGVHLPVGRVSFETGFGFARFHLAADEWPVTRQEVRYEARVGWQIVRYLTPFAGGRLTTSVDRAEDEKVRGEYMLGVSLL